MSEASSKQAVARTTTYTVSVYCARTWATGRPMGTGMRTFEVEAESSILGACDAINMAIERCNGHELIELHSPQISPNPAQLGWPLEWSVA